MTTSKTIAVKVIAFGANVSAEEQSAVTQTAQRALDSFQALIKDTPEGYEQVAIVTTMTAICGELAGRDGKQAVINLLMNTLSSVLAQISGERDRPEEHECEAAEGQTCTDGACFKCNPLH